MSQRVASYTWQDVLTLVGRKMSREINDSFGAVVANNTLNWVWDKYDWRESLSTLPSFYLVPNQQDYGAPAWVIPTDFYGLRYANLIRTDTTPPTIWPLRHIKDLLPTGTRFLPHAIGYVSDTQSLRLFPRVPDNIGSPNYIVAGQYKNRPTLVTAATLTSTLLPFDDMYFNMWVETAKWAAWTLDSDQRAGAISVQNGQTVYTGQAAVMMQMIDWVATREGLELGDVTVSPSESLVYSGNYGSLLGSGFYF